VLVGWWFGEVVIDSDVEVRQQSETTRACFRGVLAKQHKLPAKRKLHGKRFVWGCQNTGEIHSEDYIAKPPRCRRPHPFGSCPIPFTTPMPHKGGMACSRYPS
jgi:hypothetical protein